MATKIELAKHLDLSQTMITKLIDQGVLPIAKGKQKVDIDVCRIAYLNFLRRAAKHTKQDGTGDITEEKTKLVAAQAEERQLLVQKLKGELIDAEDVARVWGDYVGNVRSKLLALPSKLAHQILTIDNYGEAEQMIKELVHEALEELVNDGIPKSTVASFAASESDMEATSESVN